MKSAQPTKGVFLVIEGTDGSGKGTQANLLIERLKREGYDVAAFDFPQYDQQSSHFVKEYLNGNYGSAEEVGPYTGSLFFSLDRYEAAPKIREALAQGKVVIANRYTGSNMGHQGTKFSNREERRGYFIWLDNLEFQMLKIPRPDMNYVLRVPAAIAQQLVDQKETRNYTDKKRDLHEADLGHLERAVEVYDDMCTLFPKDFKRIDCVNDGTLLSIETVHDKLWKSLEALLPTEKGTVSLVTTEPSNPYVHKQDGVTTITEAGQKYLDAAVTNSDGNVYGFSDKVSPITIAAAMARLSRRGDDMRITILDEFADAVHKDEKLLHRVITAYGDNSVQQLVGIHMVVENASNLLTKKLEWGRLAAYLEQSTRYIYFDQKDAQGKYKYFTPQQLPSELKKSYNQSMDAIFETYSKMVRELTEYVRANSVTPADERDIAWQGATRAQACDAVRAVLPVATKSTVGIFASGQALESLIMHLMSDELAEARATGQELLDEARKILPTFLERADKPDRGGAIVAYRANNYAGMKAFTTEHLQENYSPQTEAVTLTDVWPRNELDIIPDILYEHSTSSLMSLREQVSSWSYGKKAEALSTYIGERLNRRHRPGRAIEKIHYSWDIVCDYGIFRDLQRHRMVDDLEWQALTPRYGYEIPALVEEAGLSDAYERCFDMSLSLYSLLQKSGFQLEAQYATLLGHLMRWKITYNAREAFHFHELRTSPQGHPGYRKLVLQMHEKLAATHPLLAEAMKFVNTGEDEALTRLAAERYTQFKLSQIN